MRVAVVLLCLIALVTGCQHTPPDYVSRYTPSPTTTSAIPAAAEVAIIGDTYTAGTAIGGQGPDGWPALVTARLRRQNIDIAPSVEAEDGSGYATPGAGQGDTFSDQIPKVVRKADRLVVIFGSSGDPAVPPDQLQPAVRQTLDAAHAAAPKAKIVVIGPTWTTPDPTPDILQTRDAINAEADATGAVFVDPIAARWFVDRPDLLGPDGNTPTDAGHAYMADAIAPIIAQQLASTPAG
ncbi:SGNH/GDSL hydrolase family protein [Mycolicibacterium moriokaense]|nr:SGNH/GDSL hydrolase family protein [Mycolicibacterium moriokaense]